MMPFPGLMVKELVALQNEIEKEKTKKVDREICQHFEDDCLQCTHRELGDNETLYPPYGLFGWMTAMKYIYNYLCLPHS